MRLPKERLERILELTLQEYGKLDFSDSSIGRRIPDDRIRELLAEVTTVPPRRAGGPFAARILKKARKDSTPAAKVLIGWYWWHGGGGSLWGPMGRFGQWEVSAAESDSLNTLALVLRGGRSRAADAWRSALGTK